MLACNLYRCNVTDFDIKYRSGASNGDADGMSRRSYTDINVVDTPEELLQKVLVSQSQDATLVPLIQHLETGRLPAQVAKSGYKRLGSIKVLRRNYVTSGMGLTVLSSGCRRSKKRPAHPPDDDVDDQCLCANEIYDDSFEDVSSDQDDHNDNHPLQTEPPNDSASTFDDDDFTTQDNGDDVFQVEKTLKSRLRNCTIQYLVKWAGYPINESSWEPEENILDKRISQGRPKWGIPLIVTPNVKCVHYFIDTMAQTSTGYGPRRTLIFDGDETKYELWEVKFLGHLRLQKLFDVAIKQEGETDAPSADKNANVFAELVQCLDDRSLSLVIREANNDGRKAIEVLREHYQGKGNPRIIALYTELSSLKMKNDETSTDYILRGRRKQPRP
ncbi:Chromobox protein-like 7 [Exaiptasia diaphana]|nr:Chromobox protein-like 7 [Exaiptasia diaphana]